MEIYSLMEWQGHVGMLLKTWPVLRFLKINRIVVTSFGEAGIFDCLVRNFSSLIWC